VLTFRKNILRPLQGRSDHCYQRCPISLKITVRKLRGCIFDDNSYPSFYLYIYLYIYIFFVTVTALWGHDSTYLIHRSLSAQTLVVSMRQTSRVYVYRRV
jgi:hypothetical protein